MKKTKNIMLYLYIFCTVLFCGTGFITISTASGKTYIFLGIIFLFFAALEYVSKAKARK
ncbi:hypothetical protein [Clostridium sp. C8-1-8]|jgi:uncharacterized transporter YbjL|uniref:hypothetical protein n=1 Tax=Clostridium sp. C8-1-8 TaxID=2698831 RepID=UPI00136E2BC8|nr:hypothetical protein [Clostridium sp. C8-1-8]